MPWWGAHFEKFTCSQRWTMTRDKFRLVKVMLSLIVLLRAQVTDKVVTSIYLQQIYTLATINLMKVFDGINCWYWKMVSIWWYWNLKERRKVARTLMVLAIVFAFCWLPSSVLGLILDYTAPSSSTKPGTSTSETSEYDLYIKLHRFLILLGHANSSINPFLYCLTRNFRNLAKDWYHSVRR